MKNVECLLFGLVKKMLAAPDLEEKHFNRKKNKRRKDYL